MRFEHSTSKVLSPQGGQPKSVGHREDPAPASPVELDVKAARLRDFRLEIMPNNQITGNIGLYYVCLKLSQMGLNVMPTARNSRGIDIIAYDKTGTRFIGIQVKALSKRSPVPLGKSKEVFMGDFWVIVSRLAGEPQVFILTPEEVHKHADEKVKDGKVSYWLQPRYYDQADFREAWNRIEEKVNLLEA